jgi:hypothetical protein
MTREEFKDAVMNILLNESFSSLAMLFDTEDISRYKIAQYDEDDWDDEATMPLDEFLDELYEVIKDDNT